jgi:hypothetical protein
VSPAGPDPARRPYLGYRGDDFATPFARFFEPEMAPLAPHVVDALHTGPQAPKLLTELGAAGEMLTDGHEEPTETGTAIGSDGSMRVAVLTRMPGVSPEMWDWWFGWHGGDARRYKLWHPRAHLYAEWGDGDDAGRRGRDRYVGRTSFVDEYLGSTLARAAIRFVPPSELGLDERALADPTHQTAICARVGSSDRPVDLGWLVHQVRRTEDGAEMRSRFWLGGRHTAARSTNPVARRVLPPIANRIVRPSAQSAADLLVHCAQEMSHLAARLPQLYEAFGQE